MSDPDAKIRYVIFVWYVLMVPRELKTTLIEDAKEKALLEQQKKQLAAEGNELKAQLSQLKTESTASKLQLQNKINELQAKVESQSKELSILEVQERKRYVLTIGKS